MPRISLEGEGVKKATRDSGLGGNEEKVVEQVVEKEQPVSAEDPKLQEGELRDPELMTKSGGVLLSAFVAYPLGVTFAEAEPGEKIILLLRAHLVTNIWWVLITLALVIAPIVVLPVLGVLGGLLGLGAGKGMAAVFLWYMGTFSYAFINFLYWYFNVYLITNERVIDVDWYSVVVRRVSSAPLSKLQDASAQQVGVFAGMFDFGDVFVQTAAEQENFEFKGVPYPQLVAKVLNQLMQKEEKK